MKTNDLRHPQRELLVLLTAPVPFFPFKLVHKKHEPSIITELGRQKQPGEGLAAGAQTKVESLHLHLLLGASAEVTLVRLVQETQKPVLSIYELASGH